MTATYLGGGSVGQLMPGFGSALAATGEALQALQTAVGAVTSTLDAAIVALETAAASLDTATSDLLTSAAAPALDALNAAQGALDALNLVSDPGAYLSDAIGALAAAKTLLESIIPEDYLQEAKDGVSVGIAGLETALNGVTGDIADAVAVGDDIGAATALARQAVAQLEDASAAAVAGLVAYAAMVSQLLNSGAHSIAYTGALSGLGAGIDGASPGSGISGSQTVGGCIIFASTADAATVAAIGQIFGTTL